MCISKLNGIRVSRPLECQLKMTHVQGDQAPAKRQKMLKKFEIVRREFIPPNITVNSDFYCYVLRRLRENVRPRSWNFGPTTTGSFITTMRPLARP
jgi:hypothetical protein